MRNQEEIIEWIEQYLDHKLPAEEQKTFEKRLLVDEEFAQQVRKQMIIRQVVITSARDKFKEEWKESGKELLKTIAKKRRLRTYYAAAAIILLLILVGIPIYHSFNKPTYQKLYTENFSNSNLQFLSPLAHLGNQDSSAWRSAVLACQNKEYTKAKDTLAYLIKIDSYPFHAWLYLGQLYLIENKPQQALNALEEISSNSDISLQIDALWYSALAYLSLEEISSCKRALVQLLDLSPNPLRRTKAKNLLEKLSD